MNNSIKLLVPSSKVLDTYFIGCVDNLDNVSTIFVTEFVEKISSYSGYEENIVCGYIGDKMPTRLQSFQNRLLLSRRQDSIQLFLKDREIKTDNFITMQYNYNQIKKSQVISSSSNGINYFYKLHNLLQKGSHIEKSEESSQFLNTPSWLSSSMFIQHTVAYLNLIYWLFKSIQRNKIQITQWNCLLAIVLDLAIGYYFLTYLSQTNINLSEVIMGMIEELVNYLHSLLKWVMGAPAGLKLNYSFNNMLGKYFSYHIQLWWIFLDVAGEKLDVVLDIFQYVGYLGCTFQAAMLCDLICVVMFHSYCIYVYAARLFNIQITGLTALMRMFFGRKRNPLRGGVDSCEYTNQQLFVGTVAFTILLLLLPTTATYYTVFTLFRLLSLTIQYILAKLIECVLTMPLYVTFLWAIRSPKVRGEMFLEPVNTKENSPLVLNVQMKTTPLSKLVKKFRIPFHIVKPVEWTNVITNVFTGKQII